MLRRALFLLLIFYVWSSSALALTSEEENTIAVFEEVAASVVNITTAVCDLEFFLCAVPSESGSGSGIVLNEDGTIVTNHHVISGAQRIQVTLSDGRHLAARVVASSRRDDLAILQVDVDDRPLKAITLGDSEALSIGEKVLAIGNPFGLGQTLSVGTVSMTGRNVRNNGVVLRNLIQTDAPINPGNSGGALVNSKGELVGMNTIILSPTGSSIGIGFAIPAHRIKGVVPGLLHTWERQLGWILAILLVYWLVRKLYRRARAVA